MLTLKTLNACFKNSVSLYLDDSNTEKATTQSSFWELIVCNDIQHAIEIDMFTDSAIFSNLFNRRRTSSNGLDSKRKQFKYALLFSYSTLFKEQKSHLSRCIPDLIARNLYHTAPKKYGNLSNAYDTTNERYQKTLNHLMNSVKNALLSRQHQTDIPEDLFSYILSLVTTDFEEALTWIIILSLFEENHLDSDFYKSMYEKYAIACTKPDIDSTTESDEPELLTYNQLRKKLNMSALDVGVALVANDNALYQTNPLLEGTPRQWSSFAEAYPSTFRFLVHDGKIVGNWSISTLSPKHVQLIERGEFCEGRLRLKDTKSLTFAGHENLYILNLSCNTEYNTPENRFILVLSLFEQIHSYAKRGIFFDAIYCNTFRPEHSALLKDLGFRFHIKHVITGDVYKLIMHEHFYWERLQNSSPDSKWISDLKQLYENEYKSVEVKEIPNAKNTCLVSGKTKYSIISGEESLTDQDVIQTAFLDHLVYRENFWISETQILEWFHTNPDIYILARDNTTNQIVGYINLCPVTDEAYETIKTGNYEEQAITSKDILSYNLSGVYNLVFMSIVVHPDHNNSTVCMGLINSVIDKLVHLATTKEIYAKRVIADAVSDNGEKLCKLFGMQKLYSSTHDSTMYETDLIPPKFKIFSKKIKPLHDIYSQIYMEEPYLFE